MPIEHHDEPFTVQKHAKENKLLGDNSFACSPV